MKSFRKGLLYGAAAFLLVGLTLFFCGTAAGGFGAARDIFRSGFWWDSRGLHTGRDPGSLQREEAVLDAFENVDIDLSHNDLELIPSDRWAIEICAYERLGRVSYAVRGGTLIVSQGSSAVNLGGFNGMEDTYVRIYYPEGTAFGRFETDVSFADEILPPLTASELRLTMSYGTLASDALAAQTAVLSTDFSDFTIDGLEAEEISLSASYGSAALYGASGRVRVDSSFGDITYMGEPQDGSRFTTSYGDMDITISADRALYELSAETDFGDFSVDGRDKGESYTANEGAGRRVVFETSFADTALRFE